MEDNITIKKAELDALKSELEALKAKNPIIVKNQSNGYGYKYNNLADLAKAGVKIPKTRVSVMDGVEYMEYYDEEMKEWFNAGRIIRIDMKGMNAAQSYGSSLTYARRYATMMAGRVACTDDDLIEQSKYTAKNTPNQPKRELTEKEKAEATEAVKNISEAGDFNELKTYWSGLDRKIQSIPEVMEAKNKKKQELEG